MHFNKRLILIRENMRPGMGRAGGNVRFGSKTDIGAVLINVRFAPESGHRRRKTSVTGKGLWWATNWRRPIGAARR
jgi:hypothetical protein